LDSRIGALWIALPRKSSVGTWSRFWSRCFIPTPTAIDPANLQSMRCAKPVSGAGDTTGCSTSDVKGYFDSIDWELMLKAVRQHTDCAWVLLYIERWLKAPVQMEDGSVVPRTAGTPQGGVVSPILANLFLHYAFDMWMVRTFPHIPFERYADDAICHCKSADEAQALWSALAGPFCGLQVGAASCEDKNRLLQRCKPAWRLPKPIVRLSRLQFPSEENDVARAYPRARLHARRQPKGAEGR
jgi:hypothetical protein